MPKNSLHKSKGPATKASDVMRDNRFGNTAKSITSNSLSNRRVKTPTKRGK